MNGGLGDDNNDKYCVVVVLDAADNNKAAVQYCHRECM